MTVPPTDKSVNDDAVLIARGDRTRAALADLIDRQMKPPGLAVMSALDIGPGEAVLDVGCGAGETVRQLAERVGPGGQVIGVDIGPAVLAVAKRRTAHLPQVSLLLEDAAHLALPARSMDAIYSRFGMMFFHDPVAAFTNLRRMLKPGGKMGFVCWRSMRENELDYLCIDAAGLPIEADPLPYSFEYADFIERVLEGAGFGRITVSGHDTQLSCGNAADTLSVVMQVGALGKVLRANPGLRASAEPKVRAALAARERDGAVHLGAATWIVTAEG